MKKGVFMKLRNKKGQGLVEYALIIALIAIVAVVALRAVSGSVNQELTDISTELDNAN